MRRHVRTAVRSGVISQGMVIPRGLRKLLIAAVTVASLVSASPSRSGDFVITTGYDYRDGAARLTVVSPSGSVRFTSVFPGISSRDPGRPGLTAISSDAKYAFTPLVKPDSKSSDALYVTSLAGNEYQAKKVPLGGSDTCSFMSSAPIAVGDIMSNGDYSLYVGRECIVKCARDPQGSYFRRIVLKLRYRPSTNKLYTSKNLAYRTNDNGCSSDFMSVGSLRLINNELYALMFDSAKTINLLNIDTDTVRASLGGFDYCNSWSFTIAAPDSFYGTCVIAMNNTAADTAVPTLVRVEGNSVVKGPSPPASVGDGLNRYQRIYDSVTTEPDSESIYTFLEGGQFGNATIYKLDKFDFSKAPQPVLELKSEVLVSDGRILRVGQILVVP